jgi:hypothetical protein
MPHLEDGLLHALVDGEVPSAELAPIQAHLEGCAECRNRLEQTRSLAGESDQLIGFIDVPPSGERTRVSPVGVGPARARAGLPGWIKPVALAASLILAVAIGYAGGRTEMLQASAEGDSVIALASSSRPGAEEPAPVDATTPTQPSPESAAGKGSALPRRSTDPPREQANERDDRAKSDQAEGQRRAEPAAAEKSESLVVTLQAPAPQAARDRLAMDSVRAGRPASIAAAPSAGRSAQKAPAAPASAMEEMRTIAAVAATPIDFFEAVRLLGGQIRLIEGLNPSRLEAVGSAVRVIYALPGGELVLEQRREADSITVVLTAPWLAADSLGKLREKISH